MICIFLASKRARAVLVPQLTKIPPLRLTSRQGHGDQCDHPRTRGYPLLASTAGNNNLFVKIAKINKNINQHINQNYTVDTVDHRSSLFNVHMIYLNSIPISKNINPHFRIWAWTSRMQVKQLVFLSAVSVRSLISPGEREKRVNLPQSM